MVRYSPPSLPLLLSSSSFLFLLNIFDYLAARYLNAGLLGPLAIGIIFGPEVANIIPDNLQLTFIDLGYIGLLLIVFEAGLGSSGSPKLEGITLATVTACIGVAMPIAVSFALFSIPGVFGYTRLQAFAAGASLCSTSLGTTLSLLTPRLRGTRAGSVLQCAALLDDVVGLVIVGVIQELGSRDASMGAKAPGKWELRDIVQPVMVSIAFALVVPLLAWASQLLLTLLPSRRRDRLFSSKPQFFILGLGLMGFVAGTNAAGSSDLLGAYLAGAFIAYVFEPARYTHNLNSNFSIPSKPISPIEAFDNYFAIPLYRFFSPVFFASIGSALPVRSLFSVNGSHEVVWKGMIYSLLMIFAKMCTGLCFLVWPEIRSNTGATEPYTAPDTDRPESPSNTAPMPKPLPISPATHLVPIPHTSLSKRQSVSLISLGMVARGEIALIVAQLARPILVGNNSSNSELYAVVTWAILITTIVGALGVGGLVRSWKNQGIL
ncbi:hypothetical protein BDN72DRAFT_832085 [Pluteus cervinus]|uniref:Uncharacterized protein n=1 Tax=Pluteus cervinus TaxID=181527 RepID=A0ACD3BDL6_9AGAR|nr:hypothetical protein BDN72DRAFT_832085 [Pluteus cervinus]